MLFAIVFVVQRDGKLLHEMQASRNAEMTEHEGIRDFGNPAAVEHAAL
jgi:hypothetical protein